MTKLKGFVKNYKGSALAIKPLLILFKDGDRMTCHIHPSEKYDYRAYGLIICDMVRHIANAFEVPEESVWEWVDKERHDPTTDTPTMRDGRIDDLPNVYRRK